MQEAKQPEVQKPPERVSKSKCQKILKEGLGPNVRFQNRDGGGLAVIDMIEGESRELVRVSPKEPAAVPFLPWIATRAAFQSLGFDLVIVGKKGSRVIRAVPLIRKDFGSTPSDQETETESKSTGNAEIRPLTEAEKAVERSEPCTSQSTPRAHDHGRTRGGIGRDRRQLAAREELVEEGAPAGDAKDLTGCDV